MSYTIEKITQFINAERYGDTSAKISFLLTDSRSLCFPEETLFFALRSDRNNGHHYIPELYRRGVRNFVVESVPKDFSTLYSHANFLQVSNTLTALQRLTTCHRKEFNIPIVGITGSNGKTMVKEWLSQLLSFDMNVTRSPKSYNSQIGVPLSVWLLNENSQIGLIEAGISKVGEMQALHDIIQPTIGVLTSLGAAHQENFSSLKEKCNEKLLLFKGTQALVYQLDDNVAAKCIQESHYDGKLLAWSKNDTTAAFYVNRIEKNDTTSTVIYTWQNKIHGSFTLPFIDEASVSNCITCAALALYLDILPEVLEQRMATLEPVAMRLEVKEGQHGCTLINDSYNSDINSLDIALDFMNRRPDQKRRERTLILSDIYQSGETEQQLYADVAALIKKRGVKKFIGIGTALGRQQQSFEGLETKFFFDNISDFIGSKVFESLHDEVILLKGARSFGFDKLTELLVKKVHETVLEVNLNAVVDNLNWYRSFLKPETKLICMIKADAYGAGAVEIAKTLEDHRVDYLAVAVADEGAILRRNGITSNIMIMNPEMSSFKTLFDYELEPEVYSFRLLDALIKAAEKEGITGYPVHIKLDTGMHRLGFNPRNDIDKLIEKLHHQHALIPRSVFSHFVGSDSNDFDSFSAEQFTLFDEGSKKLQTAFGHHILRHIDNSAGIEHFPERQMDMCRLGLGLYGINPRTNAIMNNVSTLKTTILQLRNVPADETVGYSRRGAIDKDSVIAAIPIGYADGLNRKLGNHNCYCLVNGKRAYYIGNICMDVALIDVTGIYCEEGDSVEIFGDNLPVTVLSDALETIPYEVLTVISNRVKRVYFQD